MWHVHYPDVSAHAQVPGGGGEERVGRGRLLSGRGGHGLGLGLGVSGGHGGDRNSAKWSKIVSE